MKLFLKSFIKTYPFINIVINYNIKYEFNATIKEIRDFKSRIRAKRFNVNNIESKPKHSRFGIKLISKK
jgi:hypothetical protein